jgi:hypothetical protein
MINFLQAQQIPNQRQRFLATSAPQTEAWLHAYAFRACYACMLAMADAAGTLVMYLVDMADTMAAQDKLTDHSAGLAMAAHDPLAADVAMAADDIDGSNADDAC